MSTASVDGILTEVDILRASRQYDVEQVRQLTLHNFKLHGLGNAFVRCRSLVRLDISRNNLESLIGVSALTGSLQYLNAAENRLTDLSDVSVCKLLEVVLLEGNELSSEAALEPLRALPSLRRLVFRRELPIDGTSEVLLLDNPLCANEEVYKQIVARYFASVLSVDGRHFRSPSPAHAVAEAIVPLPTCDALKLPCPSNDDMDERVFANAIAECRAACRRAVRM
ncbi:hypothetical protein TRVL_05490 [Trypanosoma vivax]|nr:hypothetical protein TRVL_05490 [Trypanosoma vivax]